MKTSTRKMIKEITTLLSLVLLVYLSMVSFAPKTASAEPPAAVGIDGKELDVSELSPEQLEIKMKQDLKEAQEINSDTIALMYTHELGYYPVMYSGDNVKYLRTNMYGEYFYKGEIFMSEKSGGKFSDSALLYGHKTDTNDYFTRLTEYADATKLKNMPSLYVYSDLEGFVEYQAISHQQIIDGERYYENPEDLDLSDEERIDYYYQIINQSSTRLSITRDDIKADDEFLFLQACSNFDANSLKRELVMFKRIK